MTGSLCTALSDRGSHRTGATQVGTFVIPGIWHPSLARVSTVLLSVPCEYHRGPGAFHKLSSLLCILVIIYFFEAHLITVSYISHSHDPNTELTVVQEKLAFVELRVKTQMC